MSSASHVTPSSVSGHRGRSAPRQQQPCSLSISCLRNGGGDHHCTTVEDVDVNQATVSATVLEQAATFVDDDGVNDDLALIDQSGSASNCTRSGLPKVVIAPPVACFSSVLLDDVGSGDRRWRLVLSPLEPLASGPSKSCQRRLSARRELGVPLRLLVFLGWRTSPFEGQLDDPRRCHGPQRRVLPPRWRHLSVPRNPTDQRRHRSVQLPDDGRQGQASLRMAWAMFRTSGN